MQILAGAIRASTNRSTQFTPNRLMLGREVNQPADLLFAEPKISEPLPYPQYVSDLVENLRLTHTLAREQLKSSQMIQKRAFDHKIFYNKLEIGDIVYRLNHATKIHQSNKLKAPWEGPFVVTAILSPVLVRIRNRKREFVIHHNNVQARSLRHVPLWIRRIRNSVLSPEDPKFDKEVPEEIEETEPMGLEFLFDSQSQNTKHQSLSTKPEEPYLDIPDLILPETTTRTGRQSKRPGRFTDYTN